MSQQNQDDSARLGFSATTPGSCSMGGIRSAPASPERHLPRRHPAAVLVALFWCMLSILGCDDPASEPEEADEPAVEEPDAASAPRPDPRPSLPETPLPTGHGFFLVREGSSLSPLEVTPPEVAHPTNAERGFGFLRPHGPVLHASTPLFVLWTGGLDIATLRLTRYEPETLLPERWWVDAPEGNVAWLPHAMIPLTVERISGRPGMVRLRPDVPLSPGFYVLHDGALVRARSRKGLTAFYAFQVAPAQADDAAEEQSDEALWFADAGACLDEVVNLVIDAHVLSDDDSGELVARLDDEPLARAHAARIEHCARRIHAVMVASRSDAVREHARAALLTLHALANGVPWESADTVLEATDPEYALGGLLYYWTEHEALAKALRIRHAIARDDLRAAGREAAELVALYGDDRGERGSGGASAASALGWLLWIPFYIDPAWDRLRGLSARLGSKLDPYEEAALMIAAHRVQRLRRFAERYPTSSLHSVVDAVLRGLPGAAKDAADDLDTSRVRKRTVHPGPAHVQVPTDDDATVRAHVENWIEGRARAMTRCYDTLGKRGDAPAQGLVLVEASFEQSMFGVQSRVEVRRPAPPGGTGHVLGDEDFIECLESRALASLQPGPVTANTRVVVPVAFQGDPKLAEQIR